ncbi:MAG TPA: phosphoglycerate kinase [Gemmatimonadales bacterium]|nr:phosphoglycerate kinase [Gemmatimonadales bacterium]
MSSLEGQPLEGLRALVRVDFNVPVKDGRVTDATRIRASLPTIEWLSQRGCRVILLSHLGRPGGRRDDKYSLRPVASELERMLGNPVAFIDDPTAPDAERQTRQLKRGEVALAENTRFYPGEEKNDLELARAFARLGDLYVNDAFGSAHRAHASTEAVARLLKPAVAGQLMARELQYLGTTLTNPRRPFIAVLGGAKVSDKIEVINALLPKVDELLIGGAMACTFFLAQGCEVGNSLVERDKVDLAQSLLGRAGAKLVLPPGMIVAQALTPGAPTRSVPSDRIPPGWAAYDIDEASQQDFASRIARAGTVLWNGPMGVFETPPFDRGTLAVARALAEATARGTTTIVGGGDSAAALAQAGLDQAVTHVSTGGGASLEFLEGKTLPGVAALDDA